MWDELIFGEGQAGLSRADAVKRLRRVVKHHFNIELEIFRDGNRPPTRQNGSFRTAVRQQAIRTEQPRDLRLLGSHVHPQIRPNSSLHYVNPINTIMAPLLACRQRELD